MAGTVVGCAAPPTFRNVVYEHVSQTARVLDPSGRATSRHNNFRFPPGTIVLPDNSEIADVLKREAGFIGEAQACPQRLYRLKDLTRVLPKENPVHVPYDIKIVLASPFSAQSAIANFKNSKGLADIPDNTLAWVRQVDYTISNIKAYEVNDEQFANSIKQIKADPNCAFAIKPFRSLVVRRIYVGNVNIYVRWDRGYALAVGSSIRSRVESALRFSYVGRKRVFAVETDRLGFF
ncbi:MAG: hypothetical protein GC182_05545 [Rhodopseudomonas sp.]|nr:hypothetical protein [Rhodopseudomonas sp.]